jgi:hypothetical protein
VSIESGTITLSYAPESEVVLGIDEERQLASVLALDNITLRSSPPSEKPIVGTWYRQSASIELEPVRLFLIVTGSFVAQTLLQEVIKDLYKFFKQHIRRIKKKKAPLNDVHYGILIDLRLPDGSRYYAAMSFHNEDDMVVNLHRLYRYLETTPPVFANADEPIEFTYPVPPPAFYVTSAVLKMLVGAAVAVVVYFLVHRRLLEDVVNETVASIVSLIAFCVVLLLWSLAIDLLGRMYLRHRSSVWKRSFVGDAQEWIKTISN